ncbi:hypothetical protein OG458_40745 [Streptomyces sp. NBC_01281]|nr:MULTISPECIES: hypothetical protein [unclassified Streptomyces]WSK65729.1 hypothetical protein OG458_40745 [Streptomyces sp. NBC_01281]
MSYYEQLRQIATRILVLTRLSGRLLCELACRRGLYLRANTVRQT